MSEFAAEIVFLAEGILAGKLNSSQKQFVDQFFSSFPTSPDKLERQREQYVHRDKIMAAEIRLLHKGPDAAKVGRIIKFLNKTYDSYVHGAYESAMQLFSGATHEFMLRGHHSSRERSVANAGISGKLYGGLIALELMALTRGLKQLKGEIGTARNALLDSNEQLGPP